MSVSYATTGDVSARYLEGDLIALTDDSNQAVQWPRVQQALDDASAEIDGYLGLRYVLPLLSSATRVALDTPEVLARLCIDIAVYRMQVLRPRDDVQDARARYTDATRLLKLMSVGDVTIAGAALLPGQAEFPAMASQSPGMTLLARNDGSPFARERR